MRGTRIDDGVYESVQGAGCEVVWRNESRVVNLWAVFLFIQMWAVLIAGISSCACSCYVLLRM
jgi:hypothetical protein